MQIIKQLYSNLTTSPGRTYTIGDYVVREEKLLSEGAFAYVYQVRSLEGQVFALKKMLCQDKDRYSLAKHEVQILENLTPHPNIVAYYGAATYTIGKTREVVILMEYCSGGHLLNFLDRNGGSIEENVLLSAFIDMCSGVFHLHHQTPLPIIHRDITVENIMQDASGLFKIGDFGSATNQIIATADCTRDETLKLEENIQKNTTMMYRPPEMVDLYKRQELSEKIDIWMLGCVLFTLAFHRHPFQDQSSLAITNANYRIPYTHRYSAKIPSLIHWMLAADPADRPTAETILDILSRHSSLSEIPLPQKIAEKQRIYEMKQKEDELHLATPLAEISLRASSPAPASSSSFTQLNQLPQRHLRTGGTTGSAKACKKPSRNLKSKDSKNDTNDDLVEMFAQCSNTTTVEFGEQGSADKGSSWTSPCTNPTVQADIDACHSITDDLIHMSPLAAVRPINGSWEADFGSVTRAPSFGFEDIPTGSNSAETTSRCSKSSTMTSTSTASSSTTIGSKSKNTVQGKDKSLDLITSDFIF